MSRLRLQARNASWEVIIGHIPPTKYWFVQVWDKKDKEMPLLDMGSPDRDKVCTRIRVHAKDTPARKEACDRIMLGLDPVEDPKTNVKVGW